MPCSRKMAAQLSTNRSLGWTEIEKRFRWPHVRFPSPSADRSAIPLKQQQKKRTPETAMERKSVGSLKLRLWTQIFSFEEAFSQLDKHEQSLTSISQLKTINNHCASFHKGMKGRLAFVKSSEESQTCQDLKVTNDCLPSSRGRALFLHLPQDMVHAVWPTDVLAIDDLMILTIIS